VERGRGKMLVGQRLISMRYRHTFVSEAGKFEEMRMKDRCQKSKGGTMQHK